MSTILFIDACTRGEDSRTLALSRRLLASLQASHAKQDPSEPVMIREIHLDERHLQPLTADRLRHRDALLAAGDLEDPMFDDAHTLAEADLVVIGAPYWDMSFPASLKLWIENVSVVGVTFAYTEAGAPYGLCKADALYYVTTSGGYIEDANYGYEYIAALGRLYGIGQSYCVRAEGLDIAGADVAAILDAAAAKVPG